MTNFNSLSDTEQNRKLSGGQFRTAKSLFSLKADQGERPISEANFLLKNYLCWNFLNSVKSYVFDCAILIVHEKSKTQKNKKC